MNKCENQGDLKWTDGSNSMYLKQDDIDPAGMVVTIEQIEMRTIEGRNGEADQEKMCCKIEEYDKWLVLNATNRQAIKLYTNSATPAESIGKQIEIFVDPNIAFGGKIVGGIRLRQVQDIHH